MKKLVAAALAAASFAAVAADTQLGDAVVTTPDFGIAEVDITGFLRWHLELTPGQTSAQFTVTAPGNLSAATIVTGVQSTFLPFGQPGETTYVIGITDDRGNSLLDQAGDPSAATVWSAQDMQDVHALHVNLTWDFTPGWHFVPCEQGSCRIEDNTQWVAVSFSPVQAVPEPATALLLLLGVPLLVSRYGRRAK